jgi:succinate---hydroxymethylglutarate CoA-transferase
MQVSVLVNIASNWLNGGVPGKRLGTGHESIVPYQAFEMSDGYLVIGAGTDKQFERLCNILSMPELVHNEKFQTNKGVVQ